ncbi:hypothetical protein GS883_21585 [Rhodococcus hoagii]|nr:hypothetical protein [Prescottella equi]
MVRNRHRRADRRVLPCNRGRHATRRCGKPLHAGCSPPPRQPRGRQQSRHHSSDRKTSRRRLTQRNRQGRHRRSRRPDCQVHLRPTARSVRRRFTKISNAIRKTGKNILVIVDDIDRLHSDELLSVMKAVRLLGRFDGVPLPALVRRTDSPRCPSSRPTSPETAELAHATTWRRSSSIRSHSTSPGIPPR